MGNQNITHTTGDTVDPANQGAIILIMIRVSPQSKSTTQEGVKYENIGPSLGWTQGIPQTKDTWGPLSEGSTILLLPSSPVG